MKTRHLISIISLVTLILVSANAPAANQDQKFSATASRDYQCKPHDATFTIPPGATATNFSVTLNSSWLPCDGVSTPERIGVGIPGILSVVQYYKGNTETITGNLKTLALGPGTYTVKAPDGGKLTRGTITYWIKSKKPNAPKQPAIAPVPAPPALNMGVITGEWKDPTVNSKAKIVQNGNSMTITNTFMWEGKPVTWTGNGTVSGNSINFTYSYSGYKPELWENGTMQLTRTNKRTLKGSWTSHSKKYSQNIVFIKTSPDIPTPSTPSKEPVEKKPAPVINNAPVKSGNCPPGYIDGGPGHCMPPTMKKEER